MSDTRFEVVNGQLKLKNGQQLNYEQEQTVAIEVTATDSGTPAKSVPATLTLTVVDTNDPPTLDNQIGNQTATEDVLFSFAFSAATFRDADSDSLTYTATLENGSPLPA